MDLREAMKNQNDVAMILSMHVLSSANEDNVIFSPASINSAITMHTAGPGGESFASEILSYLKSVFQQEISTIVFADHSASGSPKIKMANGLWIEKSFPVDPKFKDLFENVFKAVYAPVDFISKAEEVRKEVNAWVEHHTNGLIKDILSQGSIINNTEKIYGNAFYFKGVWKRPFDKYDTIDKKFYLLNGETVSVPFMNSNKKQYVKAYDGFKVLSLPYQQGHDDTNREFSMYFYLPNKKDGLDELLEKMTTTPGFLDSHIPSCEVQVEELRIPKFKIEFGFGVTNVLDQMGMHSIPLYHKACVEIDEEGTEAAAVTLGYGCCPTRPKMIDFVADHPFLFLIREDKTGTILFVGQIADPSESSP